MSMSDPQAIKYGTHSTDPSVRMTPMIKVKALEFVQIGDWVYLAVVGMRDFYDFYEVRIDSVTNLWYWECSGIRVDDRRYSLTDAKAACQAHHEQHVLSMIEVKNG